MNFNKYTRMQINMIISMNINTFNQILINIKFNDELIFCLILGNYFLFFFVEFSKLFNDCLHNEMQFMWVLFFFLLHSFFLI